MRVWNSLIIKSLLHYFFFNFFTYPLKIHYSLKCRYCILFDCSIPCMFQPPSHVYKSNRIAPSSMMKSIQVRVFIKKKIRPSCPHYTMLVFIYRATFIHFFCDYSSCCFFIALFSFLFCLVSLQFSIVLLCFMPSFLSNQYFLKLIFL